jgi:hypothetical protein
MTEEDIIKQLEANTQAINEIKDISLKTAKYIKWIRIMDFVKLILIILPLVAAYIYLPMLLSNLTSYYSNLMPGSVDLPQGVELPSNLKSLLK